MAITKEQWKEIAEQLSRPYGRVEIKCGDHEVTFRVEQVKGLKFGIVTYVDKELRGEWVDAESEIGKLFLCRRERFCHSPKARRLHQGDGRKTLPKEVSRYSGKEICLPRCFVVIPDRTATSLLRVAPKRRTAVDRLQAEGEHQLST